MDNIQRIMDKRRREMFVFIFYVFQANRLGGHNVTFVCITD